MNGTPLNRYLAELFGTFLLVLFGCGSAILAGGDIGFLGVALTFGVTLLFLIYCIGPVSGCHVNPAVTLCLAAANKFPKTDIVGYIAAQLIGAAIGGFVLHLIASGLPGFDIAKGFALNGFGEHSPHKFSMIACLLTEIFMTATLLYAILCSTKSYYASGFAGVAIGFTLAAIHMVSIPVTNTSVNFARSFGVAIIHGGWAINELWLFAVAHVIAIALALAVFKLTHCEKK
ncbi:MAG: aquaporin Z [Pseudomonadota bacterium]